jgi:hypothetical protein
MNDVISPVDLVKSFRDVPVLEEPRFGPTL